MNLIASCSRYKILVSCILTFLYSGKWSQGIKEALEEMVSSILTFLSKNCFCWGIIRFQMFYYFRLNFNPNNPLNVNCAAFWTAYLSGGLSVAGKLLIIIPLGWIYSDKLNQSDVQKVKACQAFPRLNTALYLKTFLFPHSLKFIYSN